MGSIVEDNTAVLEQGMMILSRLDNSAYINTCPQCFNSSIGGHIRHNIDHYSCFLNGYREGVVDYDERRRDSQVETDITSASMAIQQCIDQLAQMKGEGLDQQIRVKMDCGSTQFNQGWSQSTVHRELQFILSHTIHHYALISVICQLWGYAVPEGFGVAPSTLKHQQKSHAVCAL